MQGSVTVHAGPSVAIEDLVPAASAADLMLGAGFGGHARQAQFRRPIIRVPPAILAIRDAVLDPTTGLVTAQGNPVGQSGCYVLPPEREAVAARLAGPHDRRVQDRRCCVGSNRFSNYFHWLTQSLPAIASYRAAPDFEEATLLLPLLDDIHWQSLRLAGCEPESVYHYSQMPLAIDHLRWSTLLVAHGAPSLFHRRLYDAMASRAAPSPGGRTPRAIYVARTDAAARPMRNEDALIRLLGRYGVAPVTLSGQSLASQIALFRDARLVIGPHGAGLTNVAFCRPGAVLYELLPASCVYPYYAELARLRDVHYWADIHAAEGDAGDAIGSATRNRIGWRVDLDAVEQRLIEILASYQVG